MGSTRADNCAEMMNLFNKSDATLLLPALQWGDKLPGAILQLISLWWCVKIRVVYFFN
jgi:hypothetical protein